MRTEGTTPVKTGTPIPVKRCNVCHTVYLFSPEGAILCEDGNLWFNCSCRSTMYIAKAELDLAESRRIALILSLLDGVSPAGLEHVKIKIKIFEQLALKAETPA